MILYNTELIFSYFPIALCQSAVGQVVDISLQAIDEEGQEIDVADLCSLVDLESRFLREVIDFVFIEPQSIPKECRVVPPKILSFSCNDQRDQGEMTKGKKKKGKPRSRSNSDNGDDHISITTLVVCDACTILNSNDSGGMTGKKKGGKKKKGGEKSSSGSQGAIVQETLLPDEVIVRGLTFNAVVEERGRTERYCGCTRIQKNGYQECGK